MEVHTNTETGESDVTLIHADYDKVSQMFKNISAIQAGSNDPLLDAIRDYLPEGFDIDEENSSWETSNERENSIDLSFKIVSIIEDKKMDETLTLSLNELKDIFLEGKLRAVEEREVEDNEREEDHYDALDFGEYLHNIHQIKIIE